MTTKTTKTTKTHKRFGYDDTTACGILIGPKTQFTEENDDLVTCLRCHRAQDKTTRTANCEGLVLHSRRRYIESHTPMSQPMTCTECHEEIQSREINAAQKARNAAAS